MHTHKVYVPLRVTYVRVGAVNSLGNDNIVGVGNSRAACLSVRTELTASPSVPCYITLSVTKCYAVARHVKRVG